MTYQQLLNSMQLMNNINGTLSKPDSFFDPFPHPTKGGDIDEFNR